MRVFSALTTDFMLQILGDFVVTPSCWVFVFYPEGFHAGFLLLPLHAPYPEGCSAAPSGTSAALRVQPDHLPLRGWNPVLLDKPKGFFGDDAEDCDHHQILHVFFLFL